VGLERGKVRTLLSSSCLPAERRGKKKRGGQATPDQRGHPRRKRKRTEIMEEERKVMS